MSYGQRTYGRSLYGKTAAITFVRSFSESLGYDSLGKALNLIERNYSEAVGFSEINELKFIMIESEALGYSEKYSRTGEYFRDYEETEGLAVDYLRQAELNRLYAEAEGLAEDDVKTIGTTITESAGFSENFIKTAEVFYNESEGFSADAETFAVLNRIYNEIQGISTDRESTVIKKIFESAGYADGELVRGDNLIRIRFLDLDETLGLIDFGYRIQEIKDVDDPDFMTQFLEKYDFGLEIGEPEFNIHVGEINLDIEVTDSDDRVDG